MNIIDDIRAQEIIDAIGRDGYNSDLIPAEHRARFVTAIKWAASEAYTIKRYAGRHIVTDFTRQQPGAVYQILTQLHHN